MAADPVRDGADHQRPPEPRHAQIQLYFALGYFPKAFARTTCKRAELSN
jgi:hypothetical protein